MTDQRTLDQRCMNDSRTLESLLDDFLLSYSDEREHLSRGIAKALRPYLRILEEMPGGWGDFLTAQLMAHKLFGEVALARKYRLHTALLRRSRDEVDFFEYQLQHPWRWRFMRLLGESGKHFYNMVDVCTDETFLMRSSALTTIVQEHRRPSMLLLLTFHSGDCLQTYGPMMSFAGMLLSDILPLARMIDTRICVIEDVPASLDRNPLPFIMLWHYGNIPIVVHKKDVFVSHYLEMPNTAFTPDAQRTHFHIENIDDIFHLGLKRWNMHPHFCELYYDRKMRLLIARSMTERGWEKLTHALAGCGIHVDDSAVLRLSMFGCKIAEEHFNKTFSVAGYEQLFAPKIPKEQQEELDSINLFLQYYLEDVNADGAGDVRRAAAAAGISVETAQEIVRVVNESQERMTRNRR
jgi:hypothetical protein